MFYKPVFSDDKNIYHLIYDIFGLWMWMFDNKIHMYYNRGKGYTYKKKQARPITLYWHILQFFDH